MVSDSLGKIYSHSERSSLFYKLDKKKDDLMLEVRYVLTFFDHRVVPNHWDHDMLVKFAVHDGLFNNEQLGLYNASLALMDALWNKKPCGLADIENSVRDLDSLIGECYVIKLKTLADKLYPDGCIISKELLGGSVYRLLIKPGEDKPVIPDLCDVVQYKFFDVSKPRKYLKDYVISTFSDFKREYSISFKPHVFMRVDYDKRHGLLVFTENVKPKPSVVPEEPGLIRYAYNRVKEVIDKAVSEAINSLFP